MSDSVGRLPVYRPAGRLVNRTAECAAIEGLLERVRGGRSGSLVLVGPPGIGKSTLLEFALSAADDMSVCWIEGIESEMSLGFAGINQVVTPLLDNVGELPELHRRALEWALGLCTSDDDLTLYVVGMAVLGLLSDAASAGPRLLVVDDAQWLDEESAKVLSFVARRLREDPVGMLFAVGATGENPIARAGLPRLDITGLAEPHARELLASVSGGGIDDYVGAQIVSAAQGNPLAIVEVAGGLSADQLSGASALPEPLPLGPRVEDFFSARAVNLDAVAQTVLLLAAAEGLGDPAVVIAAARALGVVAWDEAETRAEEAGLVTPAGVRSGQPTRPPDARPARNQADGAPVGRMTDVHQTGSTPVRAVLPAMLASRDRDEIARIAARATTVCSAVRAIALSWPDYSDSALRGRALPSASR